MLEIEQFAGSLDLSSLFELPVVITDTQVTNATLLLAWDDDGGFNWRFAAPDEAESNKAESPDPLPLVIDDILVNFDEPRAKAAIAVLGQIAVTHQVLVFTCHPNVSRWFEETLEGVSIRSIPKNP